MKVGDLVKVKDTPKDQDYFRSRGWPTTNLTLIAIEYPERDSMAYFRIEGRDGRAGCYLDRLELEGGPW